jgi:hypothetical protein
MKRMRGGSEAQAGFYWNTSDWQIVTVEREPRALPGGRDQTYVKVPVAGMLFLAPLLGLSFVVFLPFVGFALVARQLGRRTMQAARAVSGKLWAEEVEPRAGRARGAARPAGRFRS